MNKNFLKVLSLLSLSNEVYHNIECENITKPQNEFSLNNKCFFSILVSQVGYVNLTENDLYSENVLY